MVVRFNEAMFCENSGTYHRYFQQKILTLQHPDVKFC